MPKLSNWRIDGDDATIESIINFLLILFIETFGEEIMGAEEVLVYNDQVADSPMLITNQSPIRIRTCVTDVVFWCQLIYQLAHEMCHYAIRQGKKDKNVSFKWVEEIFCEAFSLFALNWAAQNWNKCKLSKLNYRYNISIKDYLSREVFRMKNCDTAKNNRLVSKVEFGLMNRDCESDRNNHINEKDDVYGLYLEFPDSIKEIIFYENYFNKENIEIDLHSWKSISGNQIVIKLIGVFPEIIITKSNIPLE